MKRTWLLFGMTALVGLVSCGPSPFPTDSPITMVRQESASGKFTIERPLGWSFIDAPADPPTDTSIVAYILSTESQNAGVVVLIRHRESGLSNANEVRDWVKSLIPSTRQETEIRNGARRIGDRNTLEREYTWASVPTETTPAVLMHCLDNYQIHNAAAYALSFCVQDTNFAGLKPTFEQMIDSFEYLN